MLQVRDMRRNEWRKLGMLITFAAGELGWDIAECQGGVNTSNGNVWLYNEFECASVFIGPSCNDSIHACAFVGDDEEISDEIKSKYDLKMFLESIQKSEAVQ